MPKLTNKPIKQTDFNEYLKRYSDFSFEINVLNHLISTGFECDHGGTYDDPATNKPREFDIRARKVMKNVYIRFAVECKNVRDNYPLLVSCLPRSNKEAFHEVLVSHKPQQEVHNISSFVTINPGISEPNYKVKRLSGLYAIENPVGKSCVQVGKNQNDEIISSDAGIYDKWAQALSSADDLFVFSSQDGEKAANKTHSIVIPFLVVPNNMLWQTDYDKNGNLLNKPYNVDRCSYYVDREYSTGGVNYGELLTISHLEIVTLDGLLKFIDEYCASYHTASKRLFNNKIKNL